MRYKVPLFFILLGVFVLGVMKGGGMIDTNVSTILCACFGGIFSCCLSNLEEK